MKPLILLSEWRSGKAGAFKLSTEAMVQIWGRRLSAQLKLQASFFSSEIYTSTKEANYVYE